MGTHNIPQWEIGTTARAYQIFRINNREELANRTRNSDFSGTKQ